MAAIMLVTSTTGPWRSRAACPCCCWWRRLLTEREDSSHFLALVLMAALVTCMGVALGSTASCARRCCAERRLLLVLQLRDRDQQDAGQGARERTPAMKANSSQPLLPRPAPAPARDDAAGQRAQARHRGGRTSAQVADRAGFAMGSMFEDVLCGPSTHSAWTTGPRLYLCRAVAAAGRSEFSVLCQAKACAGVWSPTQVGQADDHVLDRILRNLLSNAVRYLRRVRCRLRPQARPWVVCQVWDTGRGIPRQHRRIFDDYFQAHNDGRLAQQGLEWPGRGAPAQPGAHAGARAVPAWPAAASVFACRAWCTPSTEAIPLPLTPQPCRLTRLPAEQGAPRQRGPRPKQTSPGATAAPPWPDPADRGHWYARAPLVLGQGGWQVAAAA